MNIIKRVWKFFTTDWVEDDPKPLRALWEYKTKGKWLVKG